MKKLALLIIVIALWSGQAWGATYYVAQTASGSGDASSVANAAAVATMVAGTAPFNDLAGDTVYLLDTITTAPNVSHSGTAGNVITLRGDEAGHAAIIDGTRFFATNRNYVTIQAITLTNSPYDYAMTISGSTNITISGCTFTAGTAAGHAIYGMDASTITITGNTFSGHNATGKGSIYIGRTSTGSSGLTITSNNISNTYYGIFVSNSSTGTITSNTLVGKTGSAIGSGIYLIATAGIDVESFTITDNTATGFAVGLNLRGQTDGDGEVKNCSVVRGNFDANSESGIEIANNANNITVTGPGTTNGNGIGGTYGSGVELYSPSETYYVHDVTVSNWTSNSNIENGLGDGVGFRFDGGAHNCTFVNVYAEDNDEVGIGMGTGGNKVYGAILVNNNTNANVDKGNVVWAGSSYDTEAYNVTSIGGLNGMNEQYGAGDNRNVVKNCIVIDATIGFKGSSSDMVAQYNDVFNCGTAYSGVSEGTGSVQVDPLLTNKAGGVYTLTGASPLKGAGLNLGTGYTDYSGVSLPTPGYGWPIGAYSYNSYGGTTGSTTGTIQ